MHVRTSLLAIAIAACATPRSRPASVQYDLLLAGGTVVDGTGAPGFAADVAIRGDRIVRVSRTPLPAANARRVIDARGRVVAPGFIDLHAHLDPLVGLPSGGSLLRQGVTTALGGPDGSSPWPLAAHLDTLARLGTGFNVAFLVGHGTIRRQVLGLEARAPTPGELERMRALVRQGMRDGAFGLSTGLKYVPGAFAGTDEIVALAAVADSSGGIYTSHLREEGLGLLDGVREAIEIGRRAGIPVILTHHKVIGQPMWGASVTTLAMVDSARAEGIDVVVDQYPYSASYTGIDILIPSWAMAGGDSAFLRRLADPDTGRRVLAATLENLRTDRGAGDIARVQFARVAWEPELEGRTLADWARMLGRPPTLETGAALVLEAARRGGASAIFHAMDEGDIERIMRHPHTMIASDGRPTEPGIAHPHPRWYGTFPRVLARYVRERHVLTLEQAIHKMTGMPAARLGLADRGRVAEGAFADIVIFDPARIADRATYEAPHQYPAGIDAVIVNGIVAVDERGFTAARPGRVLRHASSP